MSAINQGHVKSEINENGIATIEFGHPLSNSLPGKILQLLAKTITEIGAKNDVKVIILKSEGGKCVLRRC
jgi:methylglutaconyl-CoA hydratase